MMFSSIREKYGRYERHISTGALIAGFIFDNLTLRRIDYLFEQLALITYIGLALLGIVVLTIIEDRGAKIRWRRVHFFFHLIVQFSFGALFSAFFIFYFRSAAVSASWPFLLFLACLLIGNEVFKRKYEELTFRIGIFYVVLFSFFIFYLPVVLKTMGAAVFIVSGLASLLAIIFVYKVLAFFASDLAERAQVSIMFTVFLSYALLNFFYFTNIIPPVPLSLKEARVAHSVIESGNAFLISAEPRPWYASLRHTEKVHLGVGEDVSVFTAIFAPTELATNVVHTWQRYNTTTETWETVTSLRFNIFGGRGNGYRLYSTKTNPDPGSYRVNVETTRGALIGRAVFEVVRASEKPPLETITR